MITERQRFSHGPGRWGGARSALANHLKRRFHRYHPAAGRFIVAGAGAHIHHTSSVTQGGIDQTLDTRVRPAGRRIANADALVYLIVRT